MEALCSSAVGTVKRIHENSILSATCQPGTQPSREKLLDPGEWASWLLESPACLFLNKENQPPFVAVHHHLSSSHASTSLDSPLSHFPLSKCPPRKVPGVSFYSHVKVCHPLPGNLSSSLASQWERQTTSWERVLGSTKPAGPAGLKAVLKLQEGSQLFWDSPACRKQRPPITPWVCWWGWGSLLYLCPAPGWALGAEIRPGLQSGWGRGFFRSSREVGGFWDTDTFCSISCLSLERLER